MKLVTGFGYLLQGARLLTHPDLRLFVLLPLLVNIIMFAIGLGLLIFFIAGWMADVVGWLPQWNERHYVFVVGFYLLYFLAWPCFLALIYWPTLLQRHLMAYCQKKYNNT